MTGRRDCQENTDLLKLVRDGTDQARRIGSAPDPAGVKVDGRRSEHAMVFAAAYAAYLKYVRADGVPDGDWRAFFASDAQARIAGAAVEDVGSYRMTMKQLLHGLEDPELPADALQMEQTLRAVFDCIGTLALGLDEFSSDLPSNHPLRVTTRNLIRTQLSPILRRLIACYVAGAGLNVVDDTAPAPTDITILGRHLRRFGLLLTGPGLSPAWPAGVDVADWAAFINVDLTEATRMFGTGPTTVELVTHLATHYLFTAACEAFLGAFGRVVEAAREAIRAGSTADNHQPHFALFLAFLDMLEHARSETDSLPAKHLDFYYRRVLGLKERPAQPSHAHVLVELAKHVDSHLVEAGTLIKAGKDASGADAHFAVDRDLVANRAKIADTKRLYRHPQTGPLPTAAQRLFADTVPADEGPWHPFAERQYTDGELTAIAMPHAGVGFAIASHYLWLAGGNRVITVRATTKQGRTGAGKFPVGLNCRLTTGKGWLDKSVRSMSYKGAEVSFEVKLEGSDPPIVPYMGGTHGFGFTTSLPVMLVQLVNQADAPWDYPMLSNVTVQSLTLAVDVKGLKTVSIANDEGPIDGSKPFLPFGATPTKGSALTVGSKEVFQKQPAAVVISADGLASGEPSGTDPRRSAQQLVGGTWENAQYVDNGTDARVSGLSRLSPEAPDFGRDEPLSTASRAGFVRLVLSAGYGTDTYPLELAKWITGKRETEPVAPVLPMYRSLSVSYTAEQQVAKGSRSDTNGRFFHVTPFGHAEVAPAGVRLLPRFMAGPDPAEGELYLGVSGLEPPQNLALLFQMLDGTANPLVVKPESHLHWTYLRGNEWAEFPPDAVADGTDGLLSPGIVTLAVPADASTNHTLLPRGMHWVRAAVAAKTDAVCRVLEVAAQALRATSAVDPGGQATESRDLPPGTLSKLKRPDGAVKGFTQAYATFGGRDAESAIAFATRVSERLRHKDRAIALWDHEHLILETFPGIYRARCLNHTRYEPTGDGAGIYRELAPGHVTIVTIPDLAVPDTRDPLRPYTSLRTLGEIDRFLAGRMSCFATLHVCNPQFEEVRADLSVRFRAGVDETFHINRLKREITEFLSPWAYRSGVRPEFNGRIYKSVLVDFIEDRAYVDYLTDVRLFHRLPGASADGPDLDEISGSRAISILVSVPPAKHGVTAIHADDVRVEADCGCEGEAE
jgi:Baseplate J-like protein